MMVDEMGANIHMKNVYGANVLHIASQGDQPCPLYYFATIKGMTLRRGGILAFTILYYFI